MSAVQETLRRGLSIRVRGLVQGAGFRPTVWRLARDCAIAGSVSNDGDGVLIHAWGEPADLERFVTRLREAPPPLVRIDALDTEPLEGPAPPGGGFVIGPSRAGVMRNGVAPDAAVCSACVAEIHAVDGRRYRYPFTNCTHCGPRMSIITAVPYDRERTSMAGFTMCPRCRGEYEDPGDRRFHAQPNACPDCGPRLCLEPLAGADGAVPGMPLEGAEGDEIRTAARLLRHGAIFAIKGIGGFHLACDAHSARAVARLRRRKRRYHKPLALMARDMAMVRRYCRVSDDEQRQLESTPAPIVVLDMLPHAMRPDYVAAAVAPGRRSLGFMLPYTPLHRLLLDDCAGPIVLTSGNASHEPQCTSGDEARRRLAGIADFILDHDRPIEVRMDDSVVRVSAGAPRLLRRARGYTPEPLVMPPGFEAAPPVLAMGGELKNTFCLLKDGAAVVSQHVGDLEQAAVYAEYRRSLARYGELFHHIPQTVAVDLHPDYLSTKLGRATAVERGVPVTAVQHHHAHIAACLVEHGVPLDAAPVLGIALDGLGYGDDGTLWGGEFLLADYRGALRLGRLRPMPLVGGPRAVLEPWRCAYVHVKAALGWHHAVQRYGNLGLMRFLAARPLRALDAMIELGLNCPPASSCGRLFDAVAAAVGLCRERVDYEGQAAAELEALVDEACLSAPGYRLAVGGAEGLATIDSAPMWPALLDDLRGGVPVPVLAARFHRGLNDALALAAASLAEGRGIGTVVLSGGVFQNRILLGMLSRSLQSRGLTVLAPQRLPANDGGLSLGQAAVAAARRL